VRIIHSIIIVPIIVLATCQWLAALCCSINLVWFNLNLIVISIIITIKVDFSGRCRLHIVFQFLPLLRKFRVFFPHDGYALYMHSAYVITRCPSVRLSVSNMKVFRPNSTSYHHAINIELYVDGVGEITIKPPLWMRLMCAGRNFPAISRHISKTIGLQDRDIFFALECYYEKYMKSYVVYRMVTLWVSLFRHYSSKITHEN